MARGATKDGGLTTVAGGAPDLEAIAAAATGPLIFQLYWLGDRAWVTEKLSHLAGGAYKAFCLTVDAAAYSRRERDIVLNVPLQRRGPLPETQAQLTWDDVDWVRTQCPLPFGLKGILTAADARLALSHGVDFIWVSNHGGRQLDDGRATIDALSEISDVIQGRIPIVIDSGFRRATDAMKALALGASLVAFGRTALWGLACGGAEGVQKTLRLLHEELIINMKLTGNTATSRLTPDLVRRIDGSGFAVPVLQPPAPPLDPEAALLAQLSPAQRAAVRAIADSPELSEVDKMWGITEALFGKTGKST
jgi:glycolate oxidase